MIRCSSPRRPSHSSSPHSRRLANSVPLDPAGLAHRLAPLGQSPPSRPAGLVARCLPVALAGLLGLARRLAPRRLDLPLALVDPQGRVHPAALPAPEDPVDLSTGHSTAARDSSASSPCY